MYSDSSQEAKSSQQLYKPNNDGERNESIDTIVRAHIKVMS